MTKMTLYDIIRVVLAILGYALIMGLYTYWITRPVKKEKREHMSVYSWEDGTPKDFHIWDENEPVRCDGGEGMSKK